MEIKWVLLSIFTSLFLKRVEVRTNSMKMSNKSPGSSAPQRCRLILKQCLAIQLSKPGHVPEDFWMYDSGYMIFQVSFEFI